MIEYWHMCGGWYALWPDRQGRMQFAHDWPYLSLWLLKRHYPFGLER